LNITDNASIGAGATMASLVIGRRGLERRTLVHLDLLEDYMPGADGVPPGRPRMEEPYP
jgi:hypothetical protein